VGEEVKACAACGSTTRALHCATGWAAYRKGKADPHAAGCRCRLFRCATDWRAERKAQKTATHEKMVSRVYGLPPGEYDRLYRIQGGKCAILKCRATGTGRKKLAVDHCHTTGKVRGLLCSTHNRLIGAMGDDPVAFKSIAEYLELPPAYSV
jgi:hypothetical protein